MARTHRAWTLIAVAMAASAAVSCKDELPAMPRILTVEPDNGPVDMSTAVTIHGQGFQTNVVTDFQNPNGAEVERAVTARLDEFDLIGAEITSAGTIIAMVPAGMPIGDYDLVVIDGLGRKLEKPFAYKVRDTYCSDFDGHAPGESADCAGCDAVEGCGCNAASLCVPSCGDGVTRNPESCDDANRTGGDGCSSTCLVETGYVCRGAPSRCAPVCGDGVIAAAEGCDDRNTLAGDGCSDDCQVEHGYTCTTMPDGSSMCGPLCGDGEVGPGELCDDGNTIAGDGCNASCFPEQGWRCGADGGPCAPICGDGFLRGGESCDDGNFTAGDGCDGACELERGFTCGAPGTTCFTTCGDGIVAGTEDCDDRGTASGDGCSSACTLETGWHCPVEGMPCVTVCGDGAVAGPEACDDGNTASGDGCSSCAVEDGWSCAGSPSACDGHCGDSRLVSTETCDDGNTAGGDGCSPTCHLEAGFTCPTLGASCVATCGDGLVVGTETCDDRNRRNDDGCSETCAREPGWSCPTAGAPCTPVCGDSFLAGNEACDDGNTRGGDGCSPTCMVEQGFICGVAGTACTPICGDGILLGVETCDDANGTNGDGCSSTCQRELGWTCQTAGQACTPTCGDGRLVGSERCDDGNTNTGDGCSSTCAIEPGFYCTTAGAACTTRCGDGVRAGLEACDDANTGSGDGCSGACAVETGFTCPTAGALCSPICGDSRVVNGENCDDGNASGGDGCSSTCRVETGWLCGAPGTACITICGDALVAGRETCDDGNVFGGDGCSGTCALESGYTCPVPGTPCFELCGDGIRIGHETCDDANTTNGDGCSAACLLEQGFTCTTPGQLCSAICGDGLVRGAELCDDANLVDGDGCDADCRPTCGNGRLDSGEACDDGNYANGDECEADCTRPVCGNAILDVGEECDDGNQTNGDGCDVNCTTSRCGNAAVGAGEECDDGNTVAADGCENDCSYTRADSALNGDGAVLQWTPSIEPLHYALITPICNTNTSVTGSVVGSSDTYSATLTNVPNGAVITAIEITPCAALVGSGSATFTLFYALNGTGADAAQPLVITQSAQTSLGRVVFDGLQVIRTPATTLSVGARFLAGPGSVRLSGLGIRVRYYLRPFPAPTDLTAVHTGSGHVDLQWIDTTTWETGFRLERSIGVPGLWHIATTTLTTGHADLTTAHDGFLPEDQTFYYRVRAFDDVSTASSPWSGVARVVTATHLPKAPMNAVVTVDAGSNHLTWIDKSKNEDSFAIEVSVNGGPFVQTGTVDQDVTSFDDATCDATVNVCAFRVRAYNPLGWSPYSNEASTMPVIGTGPDVRLTMGATFQSSIGRQSNIFQITYDNVGTVPAPDVVLHTTVSTRGNYYLNLSSPEWRCHWEDADHYNLVLQIGRILRALRVKFPNLKQVMLSPHPYAGYAAATSFITELYGYEGGHAVKRVIQAQMNQARTGAIDPLVGDVGYVNGAAPWTTWGLYAWADGSLTNGYNISWSLPDFDTTRSYFSASALVRISQYINLYFLSSEWTPWYRFAAVAGPTYNRPGLLSATPSIVDLGPGDRYLGLPGGLYEDGSNSIPADHLAAGLDAASQMQALAPDGTPSPSGKIVLLALGYDHQRQMMQAFLPVARSDVRVRPLDAPNAPATLAIVNGAHPAGYAASIAELESPVYGAIHNALGSYTEAQVQAIWLLVANPATQANALTLSRTSENTVCEAHLGTLAPGATGRADFTINTNFSNATAVTLTVTAVDDGSSGNDANPLDNIGQTTFAAPICRRPGGPGCTN